MNDHREDIYESADSYLLRDPRESADITVLTEPDGDRWRVEFLLAGGGPTVWVVVDSRNSGSLEFHHSWGMDKQEEDCHMIEVWDDRVPGWFYAGEEIAESQ